MSAPGKARTREREREAEERSVKYGPKGNCAPLAGTVHGAVIATISRVYRICIRECRPKRALRVRACERARDRERGRKRERGRREKERKERHAVGHACFRSAASRQKGRAGVAVGAGGGDSGFAQKRVGWCESCHALGTRRCQRPRDIGALRGRGVEQDGPRGVNFNREGRWGSSSRMLGSLGRVLCGFRARRDELRLRADSGFFARLAIVNTFHIARIRVLVSRFAARDICLSARESRFVQGDIGIRNGNI